MSDIFREVDEEVRQDRALAFWTRYQSWIIVAAVVVIAATTGWRIYMARQQSFAEDTGAQYLAAMQASRDGKSAEASGAFERISRDGPAGYRQLAALRAADEYASTDAPRAIKDYDAIASNGSADPLFRDVARLRAAIVSLNAGDTKDATARLTVLANASSPFRSTARELLAATAINNEEFDTAGRWLDEIIRDSSAPSDVRQRAEAFLALVRSGRKAPK